MANDEIEQSTEEHKTTDNHASGKNVDAKELRRQRKIEYLREYRRQIKERAAAIEDGNQNVLSEDLPDQEIERRRRIREQNAARQREFRKREKNRTEEFKRLKREKYKLYQREYRKRKKEEEAIKVGKDIDIGKKRRKTITTESHGQNNPTLLNELRDFKIENNYEAIEDYNYNEDGDYGEYVKNEYSEEEVMEDSKCTVRAQLSTGVPTQRPRLKSYAVPSCNLSAFSEVNSMREIVESQENIEHSPISDPLFTEHRGEEIIYEMDPQVIHDNPTAMEIEDGAAYSTICNGRVQVKSFALMRIDEETESTATKDAEVQVARPAMKDIGAQVESLVTKDAEVQVKSGDIITTVRNLINTDEELSTMTGIESFKTLNWIVRVVKLAHKEDPRCKLDIEGKILMTFMKLKQNLSYAFLSVLFQCYTPQTCQKIFYQTVDILNERLKFAIPLSSKDEISSRASAASRHQLIKMKLKEIQCTQML